MQACSLLLGRPWEHDNDATHYGRSNKYTFVHKGKKITLVPLTPAQIIQADRGVVVLRLQGLIFQSKAGSVCHSLPQR